MLTDLIGWLETLLDLAKPDEKPGRALAKLLWVGVILVPVFLLGANHLDHLMTWQRAMPATTLWPRSPSLPMQVPYFVVACFGITIIWSRRAWLDKTLWLVAMAALSLLWSAMIARAFYGISGTTVIVRPLLPWQPDIRFALTDAVVTRRGCDHYGGFHPRNDVVFRVRYGRGAFDSIDLGQSIGRQTMPVWLRRMAPLTERPQGVSAVPGANVDERCLHALGRELDEGQRLTLERLLR